METLLSFDLHHAKLTALVPEFGLLIIDAPVAAIDEFRGFQLLDRRKARVGAKARDVDAGLRGGFENLRLFRDRDFGIVNDHSGHGSDRSFAAVQELPPFRVRDGSWFTSRDTGGWLWIVPWTARGATVPYLLTFILFNTHNRLFSKDVELVGSDFQDL